VLPNLNKIPSKSPKLNNPVIRTKSISALNAAADTFLLSFQRLNVQLSNQRLAYPPVLIMCKCPLEVKSRTFFRIFGPPASHIKAIFHWGVALASDASSRFFRPVYFSQRRHLFLRLIESSIIESSCWPDIFLLPQLRGIMASRDKGHV
jgi:hypothetical protein